MHSWWDIDQSKHFNFGAAASKKKHNMPPLHFLFCSRQNTQIFRNKKFSRTYKLALATNHKIKQCGKQNVETINEKKELSTDFLMKTTKRSWWKRIVLRGLLKNFGKEIHENYGQILTENTDRFLDGSLETTIRSQEKNILGGSLKNLAKKFVKTMNSFWQKIRTYFSVVLWKLQSDLKRRTFLVVS